MIVAIIWGSERRLNKVSLNTHKTGGQRGIVYRKEKEVLCPWSGLIAEIFKMTIRVPQFHDFQIPNESIYLV